MIMAIDVGNTNIKIGLFERSKLCHSWRMYADRDRTSDELGIILESFFHHTGRTTNEVDGIIISSVVPSMNYTLEHMCSLFFPQAGAPLFVGPGIKTGINLRYDNPRSLGSDRICNAVGAYRIYGGPVITIDFGTATTFGVVDDHANFLGGAICPGVQVSLGALIEKTSMLPKIELIKPASVIGKNAVHCIQSGIVYGYVGQVDYLISKIIAETGRKDTKLIATGGMSRLISSESTYNITINSTLTLEGLNFLYEMNR